MINIVGMSKGKVVNERFILPDENRLFGIFLQCLDTDTDHLFVRADGLELQHILRDFNIVSRKNAHVQRWRGENAMFILDNWF